jgi:hypothetical protein
VWSVSYTHGLLKKNGFSVGPFHGKNGAPIATHERQSSTPELIGT